MNNGILARGALLAALVLWLAACSRVTPENYNKLQAGMTREEVYAILGKPDDVGGGGIGRLEMSTENWRGRGHSISITFGNDKLVLKSIGETRKAPPDAPPPE